MGDSAAVLRRKADEAVRAGRYAEAADLYRRESAIYRANGDANGAKVEERKADRYTSDIQVFVHLPGDRKPPAVALPKSGGLAKWEPPYGCYTGAFIDRDERLGEPFVDENGQKHYDPDEFARQTNKKLASVFCYLSYGKPFPVRWVARLRTQGVVPHIAWEPNGGLNDVQEDAYLINFAQAASRARCPIFLRFASEMNGDWTRYGGDPQRYIEKWRLVYSVMARIAPNVAMVWCVNTIPEPPIPKFYPGDEFVDWVGINFYSVPFYDNNPQRSGEMDNPTDNLKFVYRLYADRKPIMVCEYGVSRMSKVDLKDRSAWAGRKIREMYASLPRLYPRVKLIDIFDQDNLTYAIPGRQLNNYSVTDSDVVREEYTKAVASDYFLTDIGLEDGVFGNPPPAQRIVPMAPSGYAAPRGILRISAFARCWSPRFTVVYKINGQTAATLPETGSREADLRIGAPGPQVLTAIVLDERGKVAAKREYRFTVK